MYNQIPKY
jgi:hypothetical protein